MKRSFLSVCSGIEAASVAWNPLGWEAVAYAEIDPFCCSVLAHHYPEIPNLGDFRKIGENDAGAIDVLVGGTPCQDFSIAGSREGMAGPRGELAREFLKLVDRTRPRWVVYENVPGLLSVNSGGDFGALLGGLGQRGYGFAYRVLDAQYFGVPQRRRRVFVVGCVDNWRGAGAVLLERESLLGNFKKSWETQTEAAYSFFEGVGEKSAPAASAGNSQLVFGGGNCSGNITVSPTLTGRLQRRDFNHEAFVLTPEKRLRRYTPVEAERLLGFPDNYTLVRHKSSMAKDTPRFRALGNSIAVPVLRWIAERIDMVEKSMGRAA